MPHAVASLYLLLKMAMGMHAAPFGVLKRHGIILARQAEGTGRTFRVMAHTNGAAAAGMGMICACGRHIHDLETENG